MTNRERLFILAEAVFGPRWQNATARALGLNTRQIHRWVKEEYQPSDEIIERMVAIAKEHRRQVERAIEKATLI